MKLRIFKKPSLTFMLLTAPALAHASEGPAWIYFILAPFALFAIPFFMTAVIVAIATYCYWRYRTASKKGLGMVAVLMLLVAIPAAVRDKHAYVAAKIDREHRKHVELMAKQRREARRAGKHVSPDFKAMSTACAAKYQSSGKTETDRLNWQAGRDMLQAARAIDTMQQKEPKAPPTLNEQEEREPVRTRWTLLLEVCAAILLLGTGLIGNIVARWRSRRNLSPLIHLAGLLFCVYAPVLAQIPLWMFSGSTISNLYFSWFCALGFSPLSYIIAYLLGVLIFSYVRSRNRGVNAEQSSPGENYQERVQRPGPLEPPAEEQLIYFACPGCRHPGRISAAKLPTQGLMATCSRCKTSFPVKRDSINDSSLTDVESIAFSSSDNETESAEDANIEAMSLAKPKEKTRFKLNWKKIIVAAAVLLLFNWLVQTFLLNALIILGSNAGAKFTILPPQSLLPFTLPTYVSFIDKSNGKPLAGKHVRVTWEYNSMGILPETEARYADHSYTTDAKGKVFLPPHLKPHLTYLMAFYHSFHHGIFLFLDDPGYLPVSDRPYNVPRIQGVGLAETIYFTPCRTPKDWEHVLGQSYMLPYSFLKSAVDGIVTRTGLASFDDHTLNSLSERCDALVTSASRIVDEEVVRRGPQRMYTEIYIRTLIRLGRTDEALAALPLLAVRPVAEEWQKYFKKLADGLSFEKEIEKEAAALVSSGKKANQLHEEALTLHRQKKYRQSLPFYQAAITLDPGSARFASNYASAIPVEHEFLIEKLCRRAITIDPKRAHAYMALGGVLIGSNRNLGAYLLEKESLRLGYNDTFVWSILAIAADNLKFTKEARAAVAEARKLDPNNPDLGRLKHLDN